MMKYQEPEMDIIELEFVDTTGYSDPTDDTTIWDGDTGGGTEGGTMPQI